jgi:hypothetical protein
MRTEEKVIAALRGLPPNRQAEVLDFAEFLRVRQAAATAAAPDGHGAREPQVTADFDVSSLADGGVFPPTTFEAPDAPSLYQGRPLTLAQMREAIEWEAGGAQ